MKKMSDYAKIMQVLDAKRLSVSRAEAMAGLGVSTISKMKQRKGGDGSLHDDNLEKFLRTFHVNRVWWEKQEGEMFEPAIEASQNDETALSLAAKAIAALQRRLDVADGEKDKLTRGFEKDKDALQRDKDRMTEDKTELYSIIKGLTAAVGGSTAK
jgi:hypothetical protein